MTTASVNQVQMIQRIKSEVPGARDLFELTTSRLRSARQLGFKRTIRVLREHGTVMTKEQLHDICKRLERAGVGKLHTMPNGDFQFKVDYELVSIAQVALGEAKQLAPLPMTKLNLPELTALESIKAEPAPPVKRVSDTAQRAPKMITVRYGAFEMDVPLSMDDEEREQAAELIAALPQLPTKG